MKIELAALLAAAYAMTAGVALAGDISRQANAEYLAAFAKKPGVVKTESGLLYEVLESGMGNTVTANDSVRVAYTGKLVDGYVFERTRPGETKVFPADGLIPGWKEALSMMKEGDHWQIVIPSALGYGAARTEAVPSNQVLTFDLELIEVVPPRR